MAGLKEIKRRLRSVRNTKKITYAMKLVSAAKLRKAQDAVANARAYTNALNNLLADLAAQGGDSISHPLMESRSEVKNICFLVVGGQRGLCGGYNSNLHKKVEATRKHRVIITPKPPVFTPRPPEGAEGAAQSQSNIAIDAILLGKKPSEFFRRLKHPYSKSYEDLPENANLWPIAEVSRQIELAFLNGTYDEVWIFYTRFKSAISQVATAERLLPLESTVVSGESRQVAASGMTLFEPSVTEAFSAVMPRVLASKIRQACLDAKASETASRMTAMDSATKNAGQLVRKLELKHNRLRQLVITSQLLDIVGGAEALNN